MLVGALLVELAFCSIIFALYVGGMAAMPASPPGPTSDRWRALATLGPLCVLNVLSAIITHNPWSRAAAVAAAYYCLGYVVLDLLVCWSPALAWGWGGPEASLPFAFAGARLLFPRADRQPGGRPWRVVGLLLLTLVAPLAYMTALRAGGW